MQIEMEFGGQRQAGASRPEGGAKSRAAGAEYQNWENKQSLQEWRQVVESVAAFASAKGGTVRVGIAPDGARVGVQLGKNTVEMLVNNIKTNTDPVQFPSVAIEGEEESAVIVIQVDESPVKPVSAFNVPFQRVGRTNQKLNHTQVQKLVEATTNRSWDALSAPDFAPSDANVQAMNDWCERLGQPRGINAETLWQNLGLWSGGVSIRVAVLLFAAQPTFYFPSAQIKCARFAGTDSVDFLDEKTFEGPVVDQLFDSLSFVRRNTRQGIRITGEAQHERIPEYPEEAIREAVTNALVHRDYASSATCQVRIYDDRLEVWNPGVLPDALTIEDLYKPHSSHPRNRRLALLFNRARLIEHFGTGTLRIVSSCLAVGMPQPEFSQQSGMFVVRFWNAAPEDTTEVGDNQARILRLARQQGRITTDDVARMLGIGRRSAVKRLNALREAKILQRVGDRGRYVYYTPYFPEENPAL